MGGDRGSRPQLLGPRFSYFSSSSSRPLCVVTSVRRHLCSAKRAAEETCGSESADMSSSTDAISQIAFAHSEFLQLRIRSWASTLFFQMNPCTSSTCLSWRACLGLYGPACHNFSLLAGETTRAWAMLFCA